MSQNHQVPVWQVPQPPAAPGQPFRLIRPTTQRLTDAEIAALEEQRRLNATPTQPTSRRNGAP